jgi:hypothetical protein
MGQVDLRMAVMVPLVLWLFAATVSARSVEETKLQVSTVHPETTFFYYI